MSHTLYDHSTQKFLSILEFWQGKPKLHLPWPMFQRPQCEVGTFMNWPQCFVSAGGQLLIRSFMYPSIFWFICLGFVEMTCI